MTDINRTTRAGYGEHGAKGCGQERLEGRVVEVIVRDGELVRGFAFVGDAIGRVGKDQGRPLASHQACDIDGRGGVTAQEPVIAKVPQITRLSDGLGGQLWYVVGIGEEKCWL